MSEHTLKPCPFCGGKAVMEVYALHTAVRCNDCRASGQPAPVPETWNPKHGDWAKAIANEAAKAWNRRPES